MLWLKLCILVILLSDNIFGYWDPTLASKGKRRPKKTKQQSEVERSPDEQDYLPWESTTEQSNLTDGTTTQETTTEVTTTSVPTSSVSPMEYCNTSLHTKEDLKMIFDFFANNLRIRQGILESFRSRAESIGKKYSNDISTFHQLFQDKPAHLKHVLEDMKEMRQHLMTYLNEQSNSLNEYPELLQKFEDKNETLSQVLYKFSRIQSLCDLLCEKEDLADREQVLKESVPYDHNEFYCGSIEEVRENIQSKLLNFSKSQEVEYKAKLLADDDMYSTEIQELKIKLKDMALKLFGHTMYDVLQLQDDYYHFISNVRDDDIKATSDIIKKSLAQIKPKLVTLQIALPKLENYCRKCNLNLVSRQLDDVTRVNEDIPTNNFLLDKVIFAELQSLREEIELNYTSIFTSLQEAIDNANSTNDFIDGLKPIQDEITEGIKQEVAELGQLKLLISEEYHQGMLHLAKDVQAKLTELDNANEYIENHIK